ncbi:MAG: BamA/TamA family outer membrane protein [Bernardetiaceae bacterium]|nr:BamA/TamA family outer membrane protein [Bernardetiaceae bacterium]
MKFFKFPKYASILLLISFISFLASCTGLRKLPADSKLYEGSTLEWEMAEGRIPKQKRVQAEVENALRSETNQKILWMRPRLSIHNTIKKPKKEKGLWHWLKYKVGQKPILMSDIDVKRTSQLLLNRLVINGHFEASVKSKIIEEEKIAKVLHQIQVLQPYRLDSLHFPKTGNSHLDSVFRQAQRKTLIKTGDPYDFNLLKLERERLDGALKDAGYFYFNSDFLIYKADSNATYRKINIYLQLKSQVPRMALRPYELRKIYIFPNYQVARDTIPRDKSFIVGAEAVADSSFFVLNDDSPFKSKVLARSIHLQSGLHYSRQRHEQTLRHLMSLGALKFADIRYSLLDSIANGRGFLDAFVQLVPAKKKSVRAELNMVSKSNNFAGPGVKLNFRNRNALKGAELLMLSLDGRFETQINNQALRSDGEVVGNQRGAYSYELGASADLYFPRFVGPFKLPPRYLPKTVLHAEVRLLNRVGFFNMLSSKIEYGYVWQESPAKTHRFNPVSINYIHLIDTTSAFNQAIGNNPLLQRSFENQFIIGGNYSFTYQSAAEKRENAPPNQNQWFFNGNIDLGGNLLYAAQRLLSGRESTVENPYRLFDEIYTQYARFDIDIRYYWNFSAEKHHKIATRLIAGIGIPLRSTEVLPYTKQFFSGGPNSIRAFQARAVGPGAYVTRDTTSGQFFDQTGDLRFEANIEYRFPIYSYFKGALFADAGNTWLLNEDINRPGGLFQAQNFFSELALGTGFGLRVDADFFVLRLDAAIPLRRPWLAPAQRWQFAAIDFGSGEWRRNNLVLNIAIGYPF